MLLAIQEYVAILIFLPLHSRYLEIVNELNPFLMA